MYFTKKNQVVQDFLIDKLFNDSRNGCLLLLSKSADCVYPRRGKKRLFLDDQQWKKSPTSEK